MSNLRSIVGKNIRKIRKLRKLTQVQLAKEVKIDIATIVRIETGLSFPREENLAAIAQVLDVEVYLLFKNRHVNKDEIIVKVEKSIKNLSNKNLAIINNIIDIMENC